MHYFIFPNIGPQAENIFLGRYNIGKPIMRRKCFPENVGVVFFVSYFNRYGDILSPSERPKLVIRWAKRGRNVIQDSHASLMELMGMFLFINLISGLSSSPDG